MASMAFLFFSNALIAQSFSDFAPTAYGEFMAFYTYRHGKAEIYKMRSDGSDQTRLTFNQQSQNFEPAWSPDGSKIVFHKVSGRAVHIWVMDSDGSNQRKVTEGEGANYNPAISPDNASIVFVSNRDGQRLRELYKISITGDNLERLTQDYGRNDAPRWTIDGRRIVFESGHDGNHHLYIMNNDGSNIKQLTYLKG